MVFGCGLVITAANRKIDLAAACVSIFAHAVQTHVV